jgi:autotransporter-associated beta strand protein
MVMVFQTAIDQPPYRPCAGTQTLANTNTYTGATTISDGTLKLGANHVIPNASNITIGTATLDADTRTDSAGTLDVTGNAVINLGSGYLVAGSGSPYTTWASTNAPGS